MRISSISIYNLRSIKALEKIDVSNGLDIFIGQNDCGKSTILTALDFFFNNEKSLDFIGNTEYKSDLCHQAIEHRILDPLTISSDEIGVICELKLDREDVAQTRSILLPSSINGAVTILKKCSAENRFDGSKGAAKRSTGYFVLAEKFNNEEFNNLPEKEKDLIALMDKYPKTKEELQNINDTGKPEIIERIHAIHSYANKTQRKVHSYEKLTVSAKGSIDILWPEFSLIDTKTSLDGKHKVIEDAFKKVDASIEKRFSAHLDDIKVEAGKEYDKITQRITQYAKRNYLPQLEEFTARPSLKLSIGRELILRRVGQETASHFDLQGDGTKRRMMVAILQSSAEFIKEVTQNRGDSQQEEYSPLKIWAFDEPELHLHPGAQREMFNSFSVFKDQGVQVICSTHSTVFVNSSELSSVHLIHLNDRLETVLQPQKNELQKLIKQSLGVRNSDIFYSNLFVILEGVTEQIAIPIIFESMTNKELNALGVSVIDGGGWTESKSKFDFLKTSLGNVLCLFDSDVKTRLSNELQVYEREGTVTFIGTADFEDSFSNNVWLDVLVRNFDLQGEDGGSIWTDHTLDKLRGQISQTEKNKKFFELLRRYYESKYRDLNNASTDYPKYFDKKDLGEKLAKSSIQLGIPTQIKALISKICSELLPNPQSIQNLGSQESVTRNGQRHIEEI